MALQKKTDMRDDGENLALTVPSKTAKNLVAVKTEDSDIVGTLKKRASEIPAWASKKMKDEPWFMIIVYNVLKNRKANSANDTFKQLKLITESPAFRQEFAPWIYRITDECKGYSIRSVLKAFKAMICNKLFDPAWLNRYWLPAFNTIIKCKEIFIWDAFNILEWSMKKPGFSAEWIPRLVKTMKAVEKEDTEEIRTQDSALTALRALIMKPGFTLKWLDVYWEPAVKRITQETKGDASGRCFMLLYGYITKPGFTPEWLKDGTVSSLISIANGMTGKNMQGYNRTAINIIYTLSRKDMTPEYLPYIERILRFNPSTVDAALDAFNLMMVRDDFTKEWLGRCWKPVIGMIEEKTDGNAEVEFNAFFSLLNHRSFNLGWLSDGTLNKAKAMDSRLGGTGNVEHILNLWYGIKTMGSEKTYRMAAHKTGVRMFLRYSPDLLEEAYANMSANPRLQDPKDNRPVLLALFAKSDPNGAFYSTSYRIENLMKYYRIILAESETEEGFYQVLKDVKQDQGKISALILHGHGTEGSTRLGDGDDERYMLDLGDKDEMMHVKDVFSEKPKIILVSCSTGKDQGIGQMVSLVWNGHLFAPGHSTTLKSIDLDGNGAIRDVTYLKQSEFKGVESYELLLEQGKLYNQDITREFIGGKPRKRKNR